MISIINSFRFPLVPVLPSDYPNLLRWYKADSFSLSDGTAIGGAGNEWVDATGSGHDLTQSTSARRPIFKTNIYGGNPAIQFVSANSNWLSMPLVTLAGKCTITVVGATGSSIMLGHDSQNMQIRAGHSGNNLFFFAGGGSDSLACSVANTSLRLANFRRNDLAGSIFFRENKADLTGSSGSDASTLLLDTVSDPQFGLHINGYIAEICIWSDTRLDSDLDTLYDRYFKPKYGLP